MHEQIHSKPFFHSATFISATKAAQIDMASHFFLPMQSFLFNDKFVVWLDNHVLVLRLF